MKNPVILITGAGKGIGRSIAEVLAERAAKDEHFQPKLVLCSRTKEDLETLKSACEKIGVETSIIQADITHSQNIDKIIDHCVTSFGSIDCLVNNAGVGKFGDFFELSEADYDLVMDTNLKGTFLLTQKVMKIMTKKKTGHVIFVTSVAAEKAFDQSALYCMSKFGQKGLVEVLRLYGYKNNIRVTNVLPGAVETPMWGEIPAEMSRKMMKPEDIAEVVAGSILMPSRTSVEEIVVRPISGDLQDI